MGEYVIACYRPKEGMAGALADVVRDHVPELRRLGLATERESLALRSSDGSILEIFEWVSPESVERAHQHPDVKKMWDRFGAACDYASLDSLPESHGPFPHFQRI